MLHLLLSLDFGTESWGIVMDKRNAISLLDETFDNPYDQTHFINFIKELFNDFDVSEKKHLIPEVYQEYILGEKYRDGTCYYQEFGEYTDNSRKVIDVLAIKLKRSSSVERARTMQRNFVARHLADKNKDAALVAFYGEDPEDWRFSFVKMEYHREKTDSGVKIIKDLTPAKRYSYLVGLNEPNHTCRKQFLDLIMEESINPSLDEIESAFSVEKVTKEFFDKYKELYHELRECLDNVLEKDPRVKKDFIEKDISTDNFAKKLLGQIVFLYFLQKKGWLGVERDEITGKFKDWGTGNKKFLTKLFKKEIVPYNNFFKEVLEPLFYTALAFPRDDDYYTILSFKCKIPFLNGGLFEPIEGYNWKETELLIDNSIFEKIIETFDEFNFTVKEDEPLEKEVAVDPEMLGKVFENLLDVTDRKSKGAFYTPREIVHYMCQQSLINYLETKTKEEDVDISVEDLEKFIHFGESSTSEDQRYMMEIQRYKLEIKKLFNENSSDKARSISKREKQIQDRISKLTLPVSIVKKRELIDKWLAEIKVVDPAVGSGAFPVGMMNEIVKARSILTVFYDDNIAEERTNYNLKRETIENSLYGVDIDPSAVDIAKLRFWLSLIVDEEDIKNIQPLPNLDYKIMCGNSLLEEFEGIKLFNESSIKKQSKIEEFSEMSSIQKKLRELKGLQNEFFNEQRKYQKKSLKVKIDNIEWELIEETLKESDNELSIKRLDKYEKSKSKPFFIWKLYFSEVFLRERPGFDVVIANPPYVLLQDENKDPAFIDSVKRNYETASYKIDLYHLFIEKGIELLRERGSICYITPSNFVSNNYCLKLRKYIVCNLKLQKLMFFEDDVFEANVNNLILLGRNEKNDDYGITFYRANLEGKKLNYTVIDEKNVSNLDKNTYLLIPLTNLSAEAILNHIEKNGTSLLNLASVNFGMQLRDRKKFPTDVVKYDASTSLSKFHKRCYTGKDITKYRTEYNNLYCYFNREAKKGGCWDENVHFKSNKLLVRQIGKFPTVSIDLFGYPVLNTAFMIVTNENVVSEKALLGILNSSVIKFYWVNRYGDNRSKFPKIKGEYLKLLPIACNNDMSAIEETVDNILNIKSDEYSNEDPEKQSQVTLLEKEIDQFVYRLYDLTSDEIEIIENSNLDYN